MWIINFYIFFDKSTELEALEDAEWLENKTMIGPLETLTSHNSFNSNTHLPNLTTSEASTSSILLDLSSQPQTSSSGTSTPEILLSTLSQTPVSSSLISESHKISTVLDKSFNNSSKVNAASDSVISNSESKASNSNKTIKQRAYVAKTTYSAVRVSQKSHKGHKNESQTQNHIFDPHSIYSNHQVHDR